MDVQKRESACSSYSLATSVKNNFLSEFSMEDDVLEERLISARAKLDDCLQENAIYELFCGQIHDETFEDVSLRPSLGRVRKSAKIKGRFIPLNMEQKCAVAKYALEERIKDLNLLRKEHESTAEQYEVFLKAQLERKKECAKMRLSFDRLVVQRTKYLPGVSLELTGLNEFCRFHKFYLNRLDTQLSNMRIESVNSRNEIRRRKKSLRELEEPGRMIHSVEHEQLKIHCRNALREIQRLETVCAHVKACANRIGSQLASLRLQLKQEMAKNEELEEETDRLFRMGSKMNFLVLKHEEGLQDDMLGLYRLKKWLATYRVPATSQYAHTLAEVAWLTRERLVMKRKERIAALTLQRYKKLWHHIQTK
ncbi:Coiled-coil domain-containing protein 113 [Clonorchis sinensis]|uniref:Coiled-coil domain-containing protein 113 n=1 Tax=Clonorchis sinensis TaxID=79923 RepID=A0A8T1LZ87_CLOSI|nr:Coiled-coil domain-containing protein 113 [Clonorchis sinensis]